MEELALLEPDYVISGMAQGWDTAVASAAVALGIPFTAAVPYTGQADRWRPNDQRVYRLLLEEANEVMPLSPWYYRGCYAARDKWMVNRCQIVLALYDESQPDSGTGITVRYAAEKRVPTINLWKDWTSRPRRS